MLIEVYYRVWLTTECGLLPNMAYESNGLLSNVAYGSSDLLSSVAYGSSGLLSSTIYESSDLLSNVAYGPSAPYALVNFWQISKTANSGVVASFEFEF